MSKDETGRKPMWSARSNRRELQAALGSKCQSKHTVDRLNPQPASPRHLISKFSGGPRLRSFVQGALLPVSPSDRHRGGGHPPTPATPPCVRVRTRRFELVTLTPIDQRWKSERFEVGVGKPNREGFGPSEVPGAASTTGRVASPCIITRPSPPSGRPEDFHLRVTEHAQHTTKPLARRTLPRV